MNKYKIEFKQTFKKEVTVYADDENTAMDIVEQTFCRTDLLDDSSRDLEKIETRIIEKNNEKIGDNLEENEVTLNENDIKYLENLENEVEKNVDVMREIIKEIKAENL